MDSSTDTPTPGLRPIRTLVVDNNEFFRSGLVAWLQTLPLVELIAEAASGFEAVELATALRPHLALIDIRMEGVDGLQATRMIRRDNPSTRVILMSSHEIAGIKECSLAHGANFFVSKHELHSKLPDLIARLFPNGAPHE